MIKRTKYLLLVLLMFILSTAMFVHAFAEENTIASNPIVGEWVSTDWSESGKPNYFTIWKNDQVEHYTLKPDNSLDFYE